MDGQSKPNFKHLAAVTLKKTNALLIPSQDAHNFWHYVLNICMLVSLSWQTLFSCEILVACHDKHSLCALTGLSIHSGLGELFALLVPVVCPFIMACLSRSLCRFACVTPSSVELRLSSSASNKQVCATARHLSVRIPAVWRTWCTMLWQVVSNGGPVELELVVREAGGHRLANVSSLDVLWELSDYRLAQLDSHRDVTSHVDGSAGYRRTSKGLFKLSFSSMRGYSF